GGGEARLTENQRRVIEDKYLKNAPSIEAWLMGVARNIALAELIHHPNAPLWGLFDGVRGMKKDASAPENAASPGSPPVLRSLLFHGGLQSANERDNNFQRFMKNCSAAVEKHAEAREAV